jgi:hypothetical protein
MRLSCVLLVWLLPSFVVAHSMLPTRLLFTQQDKKIQMEAMFDPLALSEALRPRGVVLRVSIESLREASPALELLFDEHLIVEAQKQECPREAPLSLLLIEGGLVQVKTTYQCETPLEPLVVRCDLFDNPRDPHSIEAVFQLAAGVVPFIFDQQSPVFRYPSKAPSSIATAPNKETRPLSWFLAAGVFLPLLLGVLFRRRGRLNP